MKKGFTLILAAFFIIATTLLAACGGGVQASKTEDVTLKIWAPANQIETGTLEKMCGLFQEAHKEWNITFVREIVGEDNAKTEILKDVSAAADVFFFANDQLEELLGAGAIARLGGETESMVKRDMPGTVVDTVTVGDAIYGIPFTHNTFFMYYDKSMLSANEIKSLDAIMAMNTPSNVFNFQFDPAGGWKGGAWYYGAGLTIFGEDQISYDKGCNWNNETGVAVTGYLIDLLADPKCVHSDDASASELAADRRLGAWFDGAWNYNTYKEVLGDDLGLAPLPTFTAGGKTHQLRGFYGSKAIGVNAHSKSMQQAVALAAFLGSEQMQIMRFVESAQIPTNMKAGNSDAVKADEIATVTMKQAETAAVMQPTNSNFGSRYWDNAGALFTEIKNGTLNHDNIQEKLDVFCKAFVIE
jgi:arabinogalactan oligomer/maltooligosaccharide transport system substrate-binding protein